MENTLTDQEKQLYNDYNEPRLFTNDQIKEIFYTHDFKEFAKQFNVNSLFDQKQCSHNHIDNQIFLQTGKNYKQISSNNQDVFNKKIKIGKISKINSKVIIKRRVLNDYINIVNKRGEIIHKIGVDQNQLEIDKDNNFYYFQKYYNSNSANELTQLFDSLHPMFKIGLKAYLKSQQRIRDKVLEAEKEILNREKVANEKKRKAQKDRMNKQKTKSVPFQDILLQNDNKEEQRKKFEQQVQLRATNMKGYLQDTQDIESGKKDIYVLQEIQKFGSDRIKLKLYESDMKQMIKEEEQEKKEQKKLKTLNNFLKIKKEKEVNQQEIQEPVQMLNSQNKTSIQLLIPIAEEDDNYQDIKDAKKTEPGINEIVSARSNQSKKSEQQLKKNHKDLKSPLLSQKQISKTNVSSLKNSPKSVSQQPQIHISETEKEQIPTDIQIQQIRLEAGEDVKPSSSLMSPDISFIKTLKNEINQNDKNSPQIYLSPDSVKNKQTVQFYIPNHNQVLKVENQQPIIIPTFANELLMKQRKSRQSYISDIFQKPKPPIETRASLSQNLLKRQLKDPGIEQNFYKQFVKGSFVKRRKDNLLKNKDNNLSYTSSSSSSHSQSQDSKNNSVTSEQKQIEQYIEQQLLSYNKKEMNDMYIDKYYNNKLLGMQKDVPPQFSAQELEQIVGKQKKGKYEGVKALVSANHVTQKEKIEQQYYDKQIRQNYGEEILQKYNDLQKDSSDYQQKSKKINQIIGNQQRKLNRGYKIVKRQYLSQLGVKKLKYWMMNDDQYIKEYQDQQKKKMEIAINKLKQQQEKLLEEQKQQKKLANNEKKNQKMIKFNSLDFMRSNNSANSYIVQEENLTTDFNTENRASTGQWDRDILSSQQKFRPKKASFVISQQRSSKQSDDGKLMAKVNFK